MISDFDRSLGSRYFLNIANDIFIRNISHRQFTLSTQLMKPNYLVQMIVRYLSAQGMGY